MNRNRVGKFYAAFLLAAAASFVLAAGSGRGAAAKPSGDSTDTELERRVAALMKQAGGQRRSRLTYNATLARVARERAYDMGARNYFDHVNPDGIGPNYLVTRAGFALPDFYGKRMSSNNIESIAGGSPTPERAWENWMGSTGHRTHLLGLTDFYAGQTEYGVGHAYVPGSRYKHYWVVISAPGGGGRPSSDEEEEEEEEVEEEDDEPAPPVRSSSNYSNVTRGPNGKLRPASGYVWVDEDDPKDLRVRLMPGLLKLSDGCYRPARGYRWVNPRDPKDLRVEPVP
ncbi:MAG: CAP domain-containing protein [Pyrinomonadaceae bacterium]